MKSRAEFEADDEVPNDALPDAGLASANGGGDPDLWSFRCGLRALRRQADPAKGCIDQELGAIALFVGVMEEFCDDDPLLVDDVAPGIGDPMKHDVSRTDLIVEDSVLSDDPRVHVGKKRIGYAAFTAEFGQHLLVVIRDGVKANPLTLEFRVGVAQLTELRPARRSPDS